jgi:hypothetical protein
VYNERAAFVKNNLWSELILGGQGVLINTTLFIGLSVWIMGFALMTAGWLVDVLFESYGVIPSKILYKTGAIIVASPVIYLLWKASRLIYTNRLNILIYVREGIEFIQFLKDSLMSM